MQKQRLAEDLEIKQDAGQFIIRKRSLPLWQLFGLFIVSFGVLFVVSTQSHLFGGYVGIGLAILAVIGPLCWFTVYFSQHNRDMLLAAEFQNALFSAAARIKSRFVMIVKNDGTVVYYDQGFTQCFPESKNRGTLFVDKIFSSEQISRGDAEKLFAALESHRAETIFIHLAHSDGAKEKLIVTLDPLPRPNGFTLIRGREYAVRQFERSNDSVQAMPSKDSGLIGTTLLPVLDAMQEGLVLWNNEGRILYMNETLKIMLGHGNAPAPLRLNEVLENTESLDITQLPKQRNMRLIMQDGQRMPFNAQFRTHQDNHNVPFHSILLTRPDESPLALDTSHKSFQSPS